MFLISCILSLQIWLFKMAGDDFIFSYCSTLQQCGVSNQLNLNKELH